MTKNSGVGSSVVSERHYAVRSGSSIPGTAMCAPWILFSRPFTQGLKYRVHFGLLNHNAVGEMGYILSSRCWLAVTCVCAGLRWTGRVAELKVPTLWMVPVQKADCCLPKLNKTLRSQELKNLPQFKLVLVRGMCTWQATNQSDGRSVGSNVGWTGENKSKSIQTKRSEGVGFQCQFINWFSLMSVSDNMDFCYSICSKFFILFDRHLQKSGVLIKSQVGLYDKKLR